MRSAKVARAWDAGTKLADAWGTQPTPFVLGKDDHHALNGEGPRAYDRDVTRQGPGRTKMTTAREREVGAGNGRRTSGGGSPPHICTPITGSPGPQKGDAREPLSHYTPTLRACTHARSVGNYIMCLVDYFYT
jgi:hypothetical protein